MKLFFPLILLVAPLWGLRFEFSSSSISSLPSTPESQTEKLTAMKLLKADQGRTTDKIKTSETTESEATSTERSAVIEPGKGIPGKKICGNNVYGESSGNKASGGPGSVVINDLFCQSI